MQDNRPLQRRVRPILALIAATVLHAGQAGADTLRLATPDGPREAIVLAAPEQPAPAVIVLHGAYGTAERTARGTGFAQAAAARGFAAVFPQGLSRQWNDGRNVGPVVAVDDVGFVRALVDELVERRIADRDRIFLAGISNGGMMTFRLLCEAAPLFAGAATIIASMPAPTGARCRPAPAVPLIMFNGTADQIVPYAGGAVGVRGIRGEVWGAERTARLFAERAGCGSVREVELEAGAHGLPVTRLEWGGCARAGGVALFRLTGAGHKVPGAVTALPRLLGPDVSGLSAATIALDFFAGRRRPAEGAPSRRP
ncbi:MAG: PHB depolymerase family esterase [Hyphomicrobiaceae bacterium]|nr:PHB depolymerase family esterase [Hyphomicrobiaceae bacterium]